MNSNNFVEVLRNSDFKVLIFLVLFFIFRLICVHFQGTPPVSDGISYNSYALAILNQSDWLVNPTFIGHLRPPVYPIFLAAIYFLFGAESFFTVYFFQVILSTLTIYYIFKLSSSIFDKKKSFLALFWAGIYFFYYWYAGMILRDTLVFFLMIFSFYHLWIFFKKWEQRNFLKSKDLWKFIIAFTILFHTDARYLFYIPFISILFVIYRKFWAGVRQYLYLLGILILLLIPWSIRNFVAYDSFVLINTRTIDLRQWPPSIRLKSFGFKRETKTNNKDYPSEDERKLIKQGKNPNNRSAAEIRIIMKDVYPASSYIGRKLYKFKRMWLPFRFWSDYKPFPGARFMGPWSLRHNILSIFFYGTLIPFMFYSLLCLFKRRHKVVWFLIFPIFVHALLHFLLVGNERYRIPIDAFIIILGCYGIIISIEHLKKIKNRKLIKSNFVDKVII